MSLFLEIIEGTDVGSRFRIGDGTKIGRTTGEILINDPKVSSLHAQVERDGRGQLLLVDRGSSNGLRINGQKVQRVALLPGVKFQIGKTTFKVVELFKDDKAPAPAEHSTSNAKDWRSVLKTQIPRLPAQNHTSIVQVLPFSPVIRLDFIEGLQADTSIVLGYGPRQLGADVLDIELQDPESPDIAFELTPDNGQVLFSTKYPQNVLLNEQALSSEHIKDGDQIRIGRSVIKVVFEKS